VFERFERFEKASVAKAKLWIAVLFFSIDTEDLAEDQEEKDERTGKDL
jgi:hypothetical protein